MKKFIKENWFKIIMLVLILTAIFTIIIKEELPILLFLFISVGLLTTIRFFSKDKRIKEFREAFNKKFPFLNKMFAAIFRIFLLVIFLFSAFIIVMGIKDSLFPENNNFDKNIESINLNNPWKPEKEFYYVVGSGLRPEPHIS